jgi:dTDP-4-dehydrorhamnose 3,5-epimerase
MRFESTSIPDIILVQPTVFSDRRGFFMETFQRRLFEEAGLPSDFVRAEYITRLALPDLSATR